jgi:hypothetical protein
MPNRSTKPVKARPDTNRSAFRVLQKTTAEVPKTPDPDAGEDPAAADLGRKGRLKGGKARAASMTKKQRTAAAKKAAAARLGNG